MQVLVKSWPNRQEASHVFLANGERKGKQRQGRQEKEIRFQTPAEKRILTFPFSLSATPLSI